LEKHLMTNYGHRKSGWVILTACFLFAAGSEAHAGITNRGADDVHLRIERKDGNLRTVSLYPEQSIGLPEDAKSVTVIAPPLGGRGDENVKVEVIEEDGDVGLITELGGTYELDKEKETGKVAIKKGIAVNQGNVPVDVILRFETGLSSRKTLYVADTLTLEKNVKEVEVASGGLFRGDEMISLSVILPDGTSHTIKRRGGKAKIKEDALF